MWPIQDHPDGIPGVGQARERKYPYSFQRADLQTVSVWLSVRDKGVRPPLQTAVANLRITSLTGIWRQASAYLCWKQRCMSADKPGKCYEIISRITYRHLKKCLERTADVTVTRDKCQGKHARLSQQRNWVPCTSAIYSNSGEKHESNRM